jgi:hypothetical protein
MRFARTGQQEDLDAAIGLFERALALTPAHSPDLPG